MIARIIVLAGSVVAFAAAAQAAGDSPLHIGDRIRVKTPALSSAIKGTLVALDDAALTLAPEGPDTAHRTFARSEIAKFEVTRGTRRNVGRGTVVGAVAGAIMVFPAAGGDNPCDWGVCVVLPVMGAAVGALVGLAIKTERWKALPVEKVRLAALPTRHGVQLSISLRF